MKKMIQQGLSIAALSVCASNAFAHGDTGSVGAGVGASYGVIGGSFDLKLVDKLYASAGIGAAGDELGYNFGLRYYLADSDRVWRPRLVANYGTNGLINRKVCIWDDICSDGEYETFEGASFGLGQSVGWGSRFRHGFEADILYIVTDGGKEDRLDELKAEGFDVDGGSSKVYFSIGYRFSF
ncbi:hypothetical protein [Agaribacterium sp. ZY112]|uniref:hypothetical protein n=1 Tax=Agaribacterium sp. ZY112 TaxID=3233574 RepID=UPI003523FECD